MDLSAGRFDRDSELALLPADLAVLMVGIAARQAASPTAATQAVLSWRAPDDRLFAPVAGAFNGGMAMQMRQWKDE